MVANTDFKIKVNAGLLTSEGTYIPTGETTPVHAELSYIMKFEYSFGYYESNGNISNLSGSFSFDNIPFIICNFYTFINAVEKEKGDTLTGSPQSFH